MVGVASDGAAMYSITALWTAAHHKIPVTFVMLSNRAYRILKLNMVEYLGHAGQRARLRGHGPDGPRPALRPAGRSDGRARQARRAPEDLAPALDEAINHQGGPFLVDVVIESPVPDKPVRTAELYGRAEFYGSGGVIRVGAELPQRLAP